MNADQLVRPGQRIGKYILGEPIARGGMAEVWSARVEGPEGFVKPVALKFVLESFRGDSELERLFVNEARVAAQLQHANLVSVFDFDKIADGEEAIGGRYYIAMERVDGYDLRRVGQEAQRRGRRLPPSVMLHIAGEVLKGLRHVHERRNPGTHRPLGLVHRDVSPHNILIGLGGEVKLSDFGIAKAMAQSFGTQSGLIRGKLAYASPEQLRNEPLDHRTDQFALGVTLWEGLAGRRLFDGTDAREIITKVNDAEVPPLPREAGVEARVEALVRRMLAAEAKRRFPSTAEALSAVLAAPGYTPDGAALAALMGELFAPAAREVPATLPLPGLKDRGAAARLSVGLAATGLAETKTLDRGADVVASPADDRATANDRVGKASAERARAGKARGADHLRGGRGTRDGGRGQRGTGASATRAVPITPRKRDPFTVTGSSYVSGAFPDDVLRLVRSRPSPRIMAVIGGVAVVVIGGIGALVWQGSRDAEAPSPAAASPSVRRPPPEEPARVEDHRIEAHRPLAPNEAPVPPEASPAAMPDTDLPGEFAPDEPTGGDAPTDELPPGRAGLAGSLSADGMRRRPPRGRHDGNPRAPDDRPTVEAPLAAGNEMRHPLPVKGNAPPAVEAGPSRATPLPTAVPEKLPAPVGITGINPNGAPVLQ